MQKTCNKARNPIDLSKSQPISPTNEKNHWHRKLRYVSAQTQQKKKKRKRIKTLTLQQQYPAVLLIFFGTFSKS